MLLSKKIIPVPVVVSALLVIAVTRPIGKPTVASILIFGIPENEINASFSSDVSIESVISIDVGSGLVRDTDFASGLAGKLVDSGRAYKVKAPFIGVHSISRNETEFTLEESGSIYEVSTPLLRVIEVRKNPISLAYQSSGKWLCRDGDKTHSLGPWVGDYVLQNGQMVMTDETQGNYSIWPLEVNAKVMVNERIYEASIVYIFAFPFDPPMGL